MAGIGVAVGLTGAIVAGRLIESLVFETSPRDPLVLGLVTATLTAVVLVAALIPARRATGVDPMEALRGE